MKTYRILYDYKNGGQRCWKEYDVVTEDRVTECVGRLYKQFPRATFRQEEVSTGTTKFVAPRGFFGKPSVDYSNYNYRSCWKLGNR